MDISPGNISCGTISLEHSLNSSSSPFICKIFPYPLGVFSPNSSSFLGVNMPSYKSFINMST